MGSGGHEWGIKRGIWDTGGGTAWGLWGTGKGIKWGTWNTGGGWHGGLLCHEWGGLWGSLWAVIQVTFSG